MHYLTQLLLPRSSHPGTNLKPANRLSVPIILRLRFCQVISLIKDDASICLRGIHPSAVLGKNTKLGKNVALGAYVVVEDDVSICRQCLYYIRGFYRQGSKIGDGFFDFILTLPYANVLLSVRK